MVSVMTNIMINILVNKMIKITIDIRKEKGKLFSMTFIQFLKTSHYIHCIIYIYEVVR